MAQNRTDGKTSPKPLRLWPGVVLVVLQWLLWLVLPIFDPGAIAYAVFGGFGCGAAIVLWWVFFSRAPWLDRLAAVAVAVAGLALTAQLLHRSVETGMMGMLFPIYSIPILSLAFVAWAVVGGRLPDALRRISMVATILLACGVWAVLRTDGVTGDLAAQFSWRWTATPEERLLARTSEEPPEPPVSAATSEQPEPPPPADEPATQPAKAETSEEPRVNTVDAPDPTPTEPTSPPPAAEPPAAASAEPEAAWPGFRGAGRDGVVSGVRIVTDWSASPPAEMWRRPVGPGWSSFAVRGDLLYTQEQRGEDEMVTCYRLSTGEPVWSHRDEARFWEANGGAGPRATPTLSGDRVYTFGATGILNVLDASDGSVVWSRNAASDADAKVPGWGFASSPLVIDDLVVIALGGRLAAYDAETGEPRWSGPKWGDSYSSPHPLTIDGVSQILLLSGAGAASVAPADGTLLWEHSWDGDSRVVQPALTADGDLLIGSGFISGTGARRVSVAHGPDGWSTEERWTSNRLKPYFNDFVVNDGHAYGFDGRILAAIDVGKGERKWKGGRYGHGQLLLLSDQDLLLVLSEQGELALVAATPDRFEELARFPAIEGKTWNHPALAGDVLLVRNGREMAAFRLALADR